MLDRLKLHWLALSDEGRQNFGLLLAIPPAIVLGLLLIWLLPNIGQVGWERYRLTATFEVDGRTVTASQIYAYKCNNESWRFPAAGCRVQGEAMAVDLGEHGKVFFVMNQWNADHTAMAGADYMITRLNFAAKGDGRPAWSNLPAMVRFNDPGNPETAEYIDPQHLDTPYGVGAVLTQFTVNETGEKETIGSIKSLLPWLSTNHAKALGSQGAAAQLNAADFKWPPA